MKGKQVDFKQMDNFAFFFCLSRSLDKSQLLCNWRTRKSLKLSSNLFGEEFSMTHAGKPSRRFLWHWAKISTKLTKDPLTLASQHYNVDNYPREKLDQLLKFLPKTVNCWMWLICYSVTRFSSVPIFTTVCLFLWPCSSSPFQSALCL